DTALDFESIYMGHCIGKGKYDKSITNDRLQIYSIRDKKTHYKKYEGPETIAPRQNIYLQFKHLSVQKKLIPIIAFKISVY
ncbi:MAG: hypothetical protein ACLRFN_02725, partial [Alphaproteobacteria bacterium]